MMSPTDCKTQASATQVSMQLSHKAEPDSTMLGGEHTQRSPLICSGAVMLESLSNSLCCKGNAAATEALQDFHTAQ